MLTHDVLDALLLRLGIEINGDPRVNILNVILLPILQIRFDHLRSSFCRLVCMTSAPGSYTVFFFPLKVNFLDSLAPQGLCVPDQHIGCSYDLPVSLGPG